jgi:ribosomal protein S11
MSNFLIKPYYLNSLEKFKLKKLQNLVHLFKNKIFFIKIRSTLNNVYVTVTNHLGQILFVNSGGFTKISSKRNTNYNLELVLNTLLKKMVSLKLQHIILSVDLLTFKKKKLILKSLQKLQIKVLGMQIISNKAFNGVRLAKRRRI